MNQPPPLPDDWTGERWVPGIWGSIAVEHLHRYALAVSLTADAEVLDMACGEGYGSAWLAHAARTVVGVDINADVVTRARQRYQTPNLRFICANATALPFPDASFDWVTCFETIEHLTDQEGLISEIRRVLRPKGRLLLSSPDRQAYAALSQHENPFHVKELSELELRTLLATDFPYQQWLAQATGFFSSFAHIEEPRPNRWKGIEMDRTAPERVQGLPQPVPVYWLVIAASLPIQPESASIFLSSRAINSTTEEPQPASNRPRWYHLGNLVDFRKGGNAQLYQCHGWDEPTSGGTWTLGRQARLQFDTCDPLGEGYLALTLIVQGLVGPEHASTQVELRLNGRLFFEGHIGQQVTLTTTLAAVELPPLDRLMLDVQILNPDSPQKLGLSSDSRPLGLLWQMAILSRRHP
jgi:ubiquinone/menaquinone biosynthesis C-methylase UbiE